MTEGKKISVKEYINSAPEGSVFFISDFLGMATYEAAKKTLQRLEGENGFTRVEKGIYIKQKYSNFLKKYTPVSVDVISQNISKKNSWNLAPTGNAALNALHLSEQVPARYEYLTDGPDRNFTIYGMPVSFSHSAIKDIRGLSENTKLVVQALKAIGNKNITEEHLRIIASNFSSEQLDAIKAESTGCSVWIHNCIRRITK